MSIKMKIVIPVSIILLVAMGSVLVANIVVFSDTINTEIMNSLDIASESLNNHVDGLLESAYISSMYLAADPGIISAMQTQDRDELLRRANQLDTAVGMDFSVFVDTMGTVILRTLDPSSYSDSLAQVYTLSMALSGKTFSAIDESTLVKISACAASPIYYGQGNLLGAVFTGIRMDTEKFVDNMKRLINVEVTVFQGDTRIATTVIQDNGTRAIGTKAAENVSRMVLNGSKYTGEAQILGREAFVEYVPIAGADGSIIGMLFVGTFTDHKNAVMNHFLLLGGGLFIAALIIGGGLILYIAGHVVAPLHPLTAFMKKAGSTGDLSLAPSDVEVIGRMAQGKDEIAHTISSAASFVGRVTEIGEILTVLAGGDLTPSVTLLSDTDTIGLALRNLIQSLNKMFGEINYSASQVSSGSKQVADGAQSLAQGATQQAASIEELSSSISVISNKTKENVTIAGETSRLAETIKSNAEKGSRQMNEMMAAVNAINEASGSISKVIKVIDDIAFQTNILALNAAVEAARAGQHGKGFAVVAEEVRNLAAKSAEAAKDTGSLIENSIEKANLGVRIAGETAESLTEIVSGINESSRLVSEIVKSSEEQSLGITQINIGIDQVAQVVQQTSATAEQSAAASEEMSGQSSVLQDLISQFKLSESSAHVLPAAGKPRLAMPEKAGPAPAGGDFGKY
ncbi:MAG: methyl-accepting chemotaxis protein [Oscillospiraceae bacterium]|nr:methyl-accepting chemotaxis protein [Oscillospiraceae bacterium]